MSTYSIERRLHGLTKTILVKQNYFLVKICLKKPRLIIFVNVRHFWSKFEFRTAYFVSYLLIKTEGILVKLQQTSHKHNCTNTAVVSIALIVITHS